MVGWRAACPEMALLEAFPFRCGLCSERLDICIHDAVKRGVQATGLASGGGFSCERIGAIATVLLTPNGQFVACLLVRQCCVQCHSGAVRNALNLLLLLKTVPQRQDHSLGQEMFRACYPDLAEGRLLETMATCRLHSRNTMPSLSVNIETKRPGVGLCLFYTCREQSCRYVIVLAKAMSSVNVTNWPFLKLFRLRPSP